MKNPYRYSIASLIVFLLLSLLFSCGERTDEQAILEQIEEITKLAEKKETEQILSHLAEGYSDFEGRGAEATRLMLESYFRRYRGIVIHVLGSRFEELTSLDASLCIDVAFSSGAAQVFRKFVKVSTQNYRLNTKLIKVGDQWLVQYADWKYITLQELFPESLPLLKEIYPEL